MGEVVQVIENHNRNVLESSLFAIRQVWSTYYWKRSKVIKSNKTVIPNTVHVLDNF